VSFAVTRWRRWRRGAGQLVVADYVGVGPFWGNRGKSGSDEGAPELGAHVLEGGFGLVGVPGLGGVAAGEVVGVVAGASQTITKVWVRNPNGTVRSTARCTRLRAWPRFPHDLG
jgi:hypothetical protein